MEVWDCFLFFNELDILEARLRELDGLVDHHVLVESPTTHRGRPKPLYYAENAERFAPWKDRIVHLVTELPAFDDPMDAEILARNSLGGAVEGADSDDLVMLCDVDEVPRAGAMDEIRDATTSGPAILAMRFFQYGLHWAHSIPWLKAKAFRVHDVYGTFEQIRHLVDIPAVPEAGWHFSYFGDPEALAYKLTNFSHSLETEAPRISGVDNLESCIAGGVSLDGSQTFDWVDVEFPPHITELLGGYGNG